MKKSNILKGICVGLFIFLNVSVTNVKAAIPDNINIWVTPKVNVIKLSQEAQSVNYNWAFYLHSFHFLSNHNSNNLSK